MRGVVGRCLWLLCSLGFGLFGLCRWLWCWFGGFLGVSCFLGGTVCGFLFSFGAVVDGGEFVFEGFFECCG